MKKRFRTPEGALPCSLSTLKKRTLQEALEYYTQDSRFLHQGREYILTSLDHTTDLALFVTPTDEPYKLFVPVSSLGTFLPDVASEGFEIEKLCSLPDRL